MAYLQVVGSLVGQILAGNAVPEVAREWVPRICSGEEIVGIGLTEPHAGSDAGMPRLTARRDGGDWVLDGVKSLSFGQDAAAVVVFAKTGPSERRGRDISALLVPLDLPGVTREPYSDMGTTAVGRGAAHLDGVRIPADHLLGEEGRGFTQVMQGFDFSRALIGLQCIGCAQQTVDETWEYVGTRQAFDQPLSKNQGVSFPLAEAETLLDGGPAAVPPDAVAEGRRPVAHHAGRHEQVVGAQDRLRRHQPVPPAARPVRLPHRAADRAAPARRPRPADRRRHRRRS